MTSDPSDPSDFSHCLDMQFPDKCLELSFFCLTFAIKLLKTKMMMLLNSILNKLTPTALKHKDGLRFINNWGGVFKKT